MTLLHTFLIIKKRNSTQCPLRVEWSCVDIQNMLGISTIVILKSFCSRGCHKLQTSRLDGLD